MVRSEEQKQLPAIKVVNPKTDSADHPAPTFYLPNWVPSTIGEVLTLGTNFF